MKDPLRFRTCAADPALPALRLLWVARADSAPGEVIDRRAHAHWSVSFIESGRGSVRIGNGDECELGAGDAFVLPRGCDHILRYDPVEPWRQLFASAVGDLVDRLFAAYGLEQGGVFRDAPIAQPLRNLLAHAGEDHDLQLAAGPALHEVCAILLRHRRDGPALPQPVQRAKAYIDAHLEHPIALTDVADAAHCSSAHLSRIFRRWVGVPPGEYLQHRRMDLAKALLSGTDLPIKAIADRLCYGDTFAFSHAFKAVIGQPPTRWRAGRTDPSPTSR